jgi:hypothetical protein
MTSVFLKSQRKLRNRNHTDRCDRCENPLAVLRSARKLPPHILINGVPADNLPASVTVQNMGSALCPYAAGGGNIPRTLTASSTHSATMVSMNKALRKTFTGSFGERCVVSVSPNPGASR